MTALHVLGAGTLVIWVATIWLAIKCEDPKAGWPIAFAAMVWSICLSVTAVIS